MSGGLWRLPDPLVLASGSTARRQLLEAAAIPHVVQPATIDERAVEAPLRASGAGLDAVALHLARAKAEAVGSTVPGRLVLGADQTLALGARMFSKPETLAAARRHLEALSGQTHSLHSAVALVRDGAVLFEAVVEARMTMRPLSDAFLDAYLAHEGDRLCSSVGAYRLEGLGIHLFTVIEGDHTTILGLPLLPVLDGLRGLDALAG